jgi:16S rRNA processing protein RimM
VTPLRPDTTLRRDRVLMGAIVDAHGVRGLVRVKSFAATPNAIASYGPLEDGHGRPYRLTLKGGAGDTLIAAIEGVTDRDQAERLKGIQLFVPRDALPATGAGEFYHADLVGLEVRLLDGSVFGRVRAVHDFGAGDTLEIAGDKGEVMVPFTTAAVPVVDIEGGFVMLDPPVGLLKE